MGGGKTLFYTLDKRCRVAGNDEILKTIFKNVMFQDLNWSTEKKKKFPPFLGHPVYGDVW